MATDLDELMLRLDEQGYHTATQEDLDAIIAYQRKVRGMSTTETKVEKAKGPKPPSLVELGLKPKVDIRRC